MVFSTSDNRQVIDEALNLLAAGLQPIVARNTGVVVAADSSMLIRLVLDRWDAAFHKQLGYRVKNLVYEVRDIRNDWAHNSRQFDYDETDRSLDSIARLLGYVGASPEAVEVNQLKEVRRRTHYRHVPSPAGKVQSQAGTGGLVEPLGDKWESFSLYLRDVAGQRLSTVRSRVSNCKRVEKFEGDLDTHFDADGCHDLLDRLTYSSHDQQFGAPQRHQVPIQGDVRNGSATLKQAVALYVNYRRYATG